jgi:hypothetical protein
VAEVKGRKNGADFTSARRQSGTRCSFRRRVFLFRAGAEFAGT